MLLFAESSQAWKLTERKDAINDQIVRTASVTSAGGATFTLMRQSDNSVWGYLRLPKGSVFAVEQQLKLRIDKNEAAEYGDEDERLMKKLGNESSVWEWNPNLVGFRIWHGKPEDGRCGTIAEIISGKKMTIRYNTSKSTFRDIFFDIGPNKTAIGTAIDLALSSCKQ